MTHDWAKDRIATTMPTGVDHGASRQHCHKSSSHFATGPVRAPAPTRGNFVAVNQGQGLILDAARAVTGTWPGTLESPSSPMLRVARCAGDHGLQLRLAAELLAAQKGFAVAQATTLTPGTLFES
jgi:hypothetical protein